MVTILENIIRENIAKGCTFNVPSSSNLITITLSLVHALIINKQLKIETKKLTTIKGVKN